MKYNLFITEIRICDIQLFYHTLVVGDVPWLEGFTCKRWRKKGGYEGFPIKSAPVKSALVKSAPSQIGLKMKVKSAPKIEIKKE
jgi:hypothetical protein